MNISNKLTISRIFIMPIFIAGVTFPGVVWKLTALICFFYVAFSDWLDGALARKYGWVSDFGKFMDPLADKIFICSAFISFVDVTYLNIPSWMIIIIISREFMITGLRTLAVSKGIVLPATNSGKFKTTSQLIAIFIILTILILKEMDVPIDYHIYFKMTPMIITGVVTLLTVISGYHYLLDNGSFLKDN
ncbi:MAG: CDP-diacylglycerol--glycerol-3-phosphate 3-phosphatidyltransferase [Elusimicrobiota bacterium]